MKKYQSIHKLELYYILERDVPQKILLSRMIVKVHINTEKGCSMTISGLLMATKEASNGFNLRVFLYFYVNVYT